MTRFRTAYGYVFFAGGFLAASLGLLVFMFLVLAKTEAFSADAHLRIETAERRFAQERSFVRIHTETEAARARARALFLAEDKIADFLGEVEGLARAAGVVLEVENVDLKTKEVSLALSVRFTGGFEETYRFLTLLETLPYASSIESATLQKKDGSAWDGAALLGVALRREAAPDL